MKILILLTIIAVPIMMNILVKFKQVFGLIFHFIAIVAYVVFGFIATFSIAEIIIHHEVFMTNIHAVFLNFYFILAGSYLGIYGLYELIRLFIKQFLKI